MEKLKEIMEKNGPFYFASVDNGQARVRPFGFKMFYEDKFYVGVGTHKACYREMLENPWVELTMMIKEGGFLRVRGKAVLDMRDEVQAYMYEVSPFLQQRYNKESGLVHATFWLDEMSAMICSAEGDMEKIV